MGSPLFNIPEIQENQSGKYITHNEALALLEGLLTRVLSRTTGSSEITPSEGDTYIVNDTYSNNTKWSADTSVSLGDVVVPTSHNGYKYECITAGTTGSSEPTWPTTIGNTVTEGTAEWKCISGIWNSGSVNDVAHYYSGAWHFLTPVEGFLIWCVDEDLQIYFAGSNWVAYSSRALPSDFAQDHDTTSGLTFGYKTGALRDDNSIISVSAGTVSLTDDATNYVEVDLSGTVSANTSGFTSGQFPLHEVVTSSGSISSVADKRTWLSASLCRSNLAANGGSVPEVDRINNFTGGVQQQNGNDILDTSDLDSHTATSDAHHSRYTDGEAEAAINNDADHGSTAQHDYYTDSDVDAHLSGGDGISYSAGAITVDSTVLRNANLESSGGNIVDKFQTETQPGQGTQAIPVTNSEGFLNQSWIAPAYGIRWDSVNDTYQAGIIQGGSFIATDYTSYPIQERMGRGVLTNDGQWEKLDPDDSSLFTDGRSATLDGSIGQVMVAIPRFHQLILRDGDYVYFLVSERSFEFKGQKSWIPQGFYKGSDQPVDYRYCGAFEAVAASDSSTASAKSIVKDTSGYSLAEPNPFTNRTRGQFRTQCNDGIFHQMDYALWEIITILFLTEFKTWNSQDALPGYTERGSWDYSYTSQAGETVSLGDASGSIYDDGLGLYIANSFRGIENPFGNVWKWLDGINIDNTSGNVHIYTCYDPANLADDTTTNYIDTGHAPGFGDTDDYIKDILGQGQLCPFYPAELGGDSSSYITDYNWNNSGAWRVLRVGGRLSDGAQAGLASLYAGNASSSSGSIVGARSAA